MSTRRLRHLALAGAALAATPMVANAAQSPHNSSRLAARAVLPAETLAPGPPSGSFLVPPGMTSVSINGIEFPRPAQPVVGFSGIVDGRRPGEFLAITDNGFGTKANSADFLIRAYHLRPDFTTARGGEGSVAVLDFVQFADPDGLIGFPIQRAGTPERWLTGADIDPESMQRDHRGDLWLGDEFGPWILHFDAEGRLLEAPIALPDGLVSPSNPHRTGDATVLGSRGLEAMAITPDGGALVFVLEGPVPGDDPRTRRMYRYDVRDSTFTRLGDHLVVDPARLVSDVQALDARRLLVLERDAGIGLNAIHRTVSIVEMAPAGQATTRTTIVDLAAIPDPDLVSLPARHPDDVGIGDPFRVTCESIEAVHVVSHSQLLLGCDNNLPNKGRNPSRADDTELIVVDVPGLQP
jgi:hypothetical protein